MAYAFATYGCVAVRSVRQTVKTQSRHPSESTIAVDQTSGEVFTRVEAWPSTQTTCGIHASHEMHTKSHTTPSTVSVVYVTCKGQLSPLLNEAA
jgi:hypothetical protein